MWPRIINVALGIWLIAAPAVIGYSGPGRMNDLIVGALAVAVALIAMVPSMRWARWFNVFLGAWLMVGPWALEFGWTTMGHRFLVGLLMLSSALVRARARRDIAPQSVGSASSRSYP